MKKYLGGLSLLLLLALALAFGVTSRGSRQLANVSRRPQRSNLEEKIKEEVGKPTPIQEGVMTEKQRKHSKIFKRFEGSTGGRKLRDLAAERRDVYVVNMVADGKVIKDFDLNTYLKRLTCRSNAVVIGTVTSKSSQLIDEGTFTFTDYEIVVNDILKNNAGAPFEVNQTLTYTSPGGSVELNGKVIGAVDFRSEPLQLGERYLFYLNFLPETGSYKGFSNDIDGDTFLIKRGVATQASKKPLPLGSKRNTDAEQFLDAVRIAAHQPCSN